MLKSLLIKATILAAAISPSCYSPIYPEFKKEIMDYNTCEEAEKAYQDKVVKDDAPIEFWKLRANLAECYLASAWLGLTALRDDDNDNYLPIEQDCDQANRNLLLIPEKYQLEENVSNLIEHYYFLCYSVLEYHKDKEIEPRPGHGEIINFERK